MYAFGKENDFVIMTRKLCNADFCPKERKKKKKKKRKEKKRKKGKENFRVV